MDNGDTEMLHSIMYYRAGQRARTGPAANAVAAALKGATSAASVKERLGADGYDWGEMVAASILAGGKKGGVGYNTWKKAFDKHIRGIPGSGMMVRLNSRISGATGDSFRAVLTGATTSHTDAGGLVRAGVITLEPEDSVVDKFMEESSTEYQSAGLSSALASRATSAATGTPNVYWQSRASSAKLELAEIHSGRRYDIDDAKRDMERKDDPTSGDMVVERESLSNVMRAQIGAPISFHEPIDEAYLKKPSNELFTVHLEERDQLTLKIAEKRLEADAWSGETDINKLETVQALVRSSGGEISVELANEIVDDAVLGLEDGPRKVVKRGGGIGMGYPLTRQDIAAGLNVPAEVMLQKYTPAQLVRSVLASDWKIQMRQRYAVDQLRKRF